MRSLRYFAISLIASLSIVIFAAGGSIQAAGNDREAHNKLMQGAKKMRDGNKQVMKMAAKKRIKDPELQQAAKEMDNGYNMVTKGASKISGDEGKKLVTRGANMMVDADRATKSAIEKHGTVDEYSRGFGMSENGEKMVGQAFMTYGLQGNWRGEH